MTSKPCDALARPSVLVERMESHARAIVLLSISFKAQNVTVMQASRSVWKAKGARGLCPSASLRCQPVALEEVVLDCVLQ